jgi:hypothetical protein
VIEEGHQPGHDLDVERRGPECFSSMVSKGSHVLTGDLGDPLISNVL